MINDGQVMAKFVWEAGKKEEESPVYFRILRMDALSEMFANVIILIRI